MNERKALDEMMVIKIIGGCLKSLSQHVSPSRIISVDKSFLLRIISVDNEAEKKKISLFSSARQAWHIQ